MSSFEYEGKDVDKAVQKACEELNLIQDEIKYEVLSYGSSGIFGLVGAKKARIIVYMPEKVEEPENESVETAFTEALPGVEEHPSEGEDAADQRIYEYPDNPLELGCSVLQRIVDSITADAEISAEEENGRIFLNVTGGNAALLIGKKGQTLEAIQSLVEKIVNKHHNNNHKDRIRIQVDVEGYLETRKTNLEKLAMRLADKSKRIRKPISLGQMSGYDRRIVHMVLKGDPGIRTKSQGEGYMRKIVIFPKKNNPPI
jgi:spoIIIJ-associated protein